MPEYGVADNPHLIYPLLGQEFDSITSRSDARKAEHYLTLIGRERRASQPPCQFFIFLLHFKYRYQAESSQVFMLYVEV